MKKSAQDMSFLPKITLILIGMLFTTTLLAVDKAKAPPKKKFSLSILQSKYKKAESLEADFLQEVYQASLARTKSSKGNIKLAKPGLVRWETVEPEANIMVSNGRKLWYYTPDAANGKGQVLERKAAELRRQPIYQILTGSVALDKEFKVKITIENTDKNIINEFSWVDLQLTPKKNMGDLKFAHIKVSSKYLISEINLENQSGNKTKITLQNQNLGAKLPPVLFNFTPPEGVELLKDGA